MCCAIGALLIAVIAMWRRGFRFAAGWRRHARWAAACAAAAILLVAGSALAVQHFDHYAMRAQANGRTVLAEIWAQPICSTGSSRDHPGAVQAAFMRQARARAQLKAPRASIGQSASTWPSRIPT